MGQPDWMMRKIFAILNEAKCTDKDKRLKVMGFIAVREITSANDLDEFELRMVMDTLAYWQRSHELVERIERVVGDAQA